MKRILSIAAILAGFATAASAADFPAIPRAAPLPVPIFFSWSGCYVGAVGGENLGKSEQLAKSGPNFGSTITGQFSLTGGIAGGTVGCNVQLSSFVIGAEGDFSWTNAKGSANSRLPFLAGTLNTTREKWMDTFRGRFGYAFDRFMIYGTAGVAVTGSEVSVANAAFGTVAQSMDRTGWVVGVGGEWAAWSGPLGDVSFKVEYLHAGFESKQYFVAPVTVSGVSIVTRDTSLNDDLIRAGVNVKFNWGGPVVARY